MKEKKANNSSMSLPESLPRSLIFIAIIVAAGIAILILRPDSLPTTGHQESETNIKQENTITKSADSITKRDEYDEYIETENYQQNVENDLEESPFANGQENEGIVEEVNTPKSLNEPAGPPHAPAMADSYAPMPIGLPGENSAIN